MSATPAPSTAPVPPPGGAGALYRAVWRWHFYAGILVAPFAIFLAITGAIYLWKPQYEASRYRELFTAPVPSGSTTVSAAAQLAAAQAAVPAAWLSLATVFLLVTGLLWTKGAGQWYRTLSAAVGQATPREATASAHRSELVGWSPPLQAGLAEKIDALASTPPADDPHAEHRSPTDSQSKIENPNSKITPLPLDRIIALAEEHAVPRPYAIALPAGPRGIYSALTDRNQAFNRGYLHLDQYSGKVLADVRSKDFGLLARFGLWGIIAHEGRLFGLANQLLGTAAALGVVLLAVSGLVLWWQRRPAGQLAAPPSDAALPRPVLVGTLALAALLPLLAASLTLLWLADRRFARRLARLFSA